MTRPTDEEDSLSRATVRIPKSWPMITFVTLIVGATVLFVDNKTTVADHSKDLQQLKADIVEAKKAQIASDKVLVVLEANTQMILNSVNQIRQDMRDAARQSKEGK